MAHFRGAPSLGTDLTLETQLMPVSHGTNEPERPTLMPPTCDPRTLAAVEFVSKDVERSSPTALKPFF